jgi:hypothetical protein
MEHTVTARASGFPTIFSSGSNGWRMLLALEVAIKLE